MQIVSARNLPRSPTPDAVLRVQIVSARNLPRSPTPDAVLRVQIVSARNLPGSDWTLSSWITGVMTSDPYVVVRVGANKRTTPVISKNCDPDWETGNVFHFPVELPMEQILELDVGRF